MKIPALFLAAGMTSATSVTEATMTQRDATSRISSGAIFAAAFVFLGMRDAAHGAPHDLPPSPSASCKAGDLTVNANGQLAWRARFSDGTLAQDGSASLRFERLGVGALYFEMIPANLDAPSVAFVDMRLQCPTAPGRLIGLLSGDGWLVTAGGPRLLHALNEPLVSLGNGSYALQFRVECSHKCWGHFENLKLVP